MKLINNEQSFYKLRNMFCQYLLKMTVGTAIWKRFVRSFAGSVTIYEYVYQSAILQYFSANTFQNEVSCVDVSLYYAVYVTGL